MPALLARDICGRGRRGDAGRREDMKLLPDAQPLLAATQLPAVRHALTCTANLDVLLWSFRAVAAQPLVFDDDWMSRHVDCTDEFDLRRATAVVDARLRDGADAADRAYLR